MSDLVQRLRNADKLVCTVERCSLDEHEGVCKEAADRIEALEKVLQYMLDPHAQLWRMREKAEAALKEGKS